MSCQGQLDKFKVCDGVKVSDLIKEIRDDIGHHWKTLAHDLKLSQTDIDAIEHDNLLNLKEQIYQLFIKWKKQEGNNATSDVLIDHLVSAKLDNILKSLERKHFIKETGSGIPIEETQPAPKQPQLMRIKDAGNNDDVEVDEGKKRIVPAATTPEEEKRCKIRVKRLARFSSDKTGEGPFEEGCVVMVDSLGYGVIQWLGQFSTGSGELTAGIEFEESVPGGGSGEFVDGVKHFSCDPGYGLYLPYERLKEDGRFSSKTPMAQSNRTATVAAEHSEHSVPLSADESTITTTSEDEQLLLKRLISLTANDTASKPLKFFIPSDRTGLVIGKEGKNILEVERATNTAIKLDSRPGLTGNTAGVITGSEENCKRAVLMIYQKLSHKVSVHTAASVTIKVADNMVGRVIGKKGVTIDTIKSLSEAQEIKISDRPTGLMALLNPERECTITGSHDQIEEAKKLIQRVIEGEDIVTNARVAAMMTKLGIILGSEESNCVLS